MPQAKFVQEEVTEKNTLFTATYLEMKNACLVFFSEKEEQLGTLATAIPQRRKITGHPISSILLGDRNIMVARLLAEHLARMMNKIALVSVFIKTVHEREAGPILLGLLEKVIKKA